MNRAAVSKRRKAILERLEALQSMSSKFLHVSEPMVHGWVRQNRRKCGQPRCRCVQGELHETLTFGTQEEGKGIHRGIPPENREALQASTQRWRRFRQARAGLVKEFGRLLQEVDSLEGLLSEPWQPWVQQKKKRKGIAKK